MKGSWVVTVDRIGDGEAIGVHGPSDTELSGSEVRRHPDRKRFRMLDDDGEVYYQGFLVGGDGFEPLDDYGRPNAGCTEIQFWEREPETHRDRWVTL
jgi:hypothetical protein